MGNLHALHGYDYQFTVNLLFILEAIINEDRQKELEIFVEKENEEDAQIIFNKNGSQYILDIQSKHSIHPITNEEFSEWLSHFEAYSSENFLLDKLFKSENRNVVFVSNNRFSNDLTIYLGTNFFAELNNLKQSNFDFIITEIIRNKTNLTPLNSLRYTKLKEFFDTTCTGLNSRKNIFSKIRIRENLSDELLEDKIRGLLNKKYKISSSKINKVIIELIDIIRKNAGNSISVTQMILEVLTENSQTTVFRKQNNHIERKEKKYCSEILSQNNILFLTGLPFCGKTLLAKELAQEYMDEGFTIAITDNISKARHFLENTNEDDKILIFEDPFGAVEVKNEVQNIVKGFYDLLNLVEASKKIIVTSRLDILINVLKERSLEDCSINNNNWHDLTLSDKSLSLACWNNYFSIGANSSLFEKIMNCLKQRNDSSIFQFGHINYIFNKYKTIENMENLSPDEIISVARLDSEGIKNLILSRGETITKLYLSLCLTANSNDSVDISSLAFVLYNIQSYDESTKFKLDYKSYILSKKQSPQFPVYKESFTLSKEDFSELEFLIDRGFLEVDDFEQLRFSHPIYHYAGVLMFLELLPKKFSVIKAQEYIKNSLYLLSGALVYNSLSVLEILLQKMKYKNELKNLIFSMLYSIFPIVRNKTINIFDGNVEILDENDMRKFVTIIKGEYYDSEDIVWENGMPWYDISKERKMKFVFIPGMDLSEEGNPEQIKSLDQELWNELRTYREIPHSKEFLYRCLNSKETFIKSKAFLKLFEMYPEEFDSLRKYLNIESHCLIIYSIFTGAIKSWFSYSKETRLIIKEYFITSLKKVSVSIIATKFLQKFEREYDNDYIEWSEYIEEQKNELWELWADIFIEFSNRYSAFNNFMYEPHLFTTIDYSLPYIKDQMKIIEISKAWFNWLKNYGSSDYAYSLVDFLMKGTENNSLIREEIFREILEVENTSLIVASLNHFINNWDLLSSSEKKEIILLLKRKDRKDIKWLISTALTRRDVPLEISNSIFNFSSHFLEMDSNSLYLKVKELEILEELTAVINGDPGELHNILGSSSYSFKYWEKLMIEIIKNEGDGMALTIALEAFIRRIYDRNSSEVINHEIFISFINDSNTRKKIFSAMLYITCVCVQNNKKMWDSYFEVISSEEREENINEILMYIEAIQNKRNHKDLFELFDEELVEKLLNKSKNDELLLKFRNIIEVLNENMDLQRMSENLPDFLKCYIQLPPRFTITNDLLRITMEEIGFSNLEIFEQRRRKLIDISSEKEREIEKIFRKDIELKNWNVN